MRDRKLNLKREVLVELSDNEMSVIAGQGILEQASQIVCAGTYLVCVSNSCPSGQITYTALCA